MVAIKQANSILDWHEHLVPEDRPPRWMWSLDEEIIDWFEALAEKRDQERKDREDDREEVPQWENELAKGRGR